MAARSGEFQGQETESHNGDAESKGEEEKQEQGEYEDDNDDYDDEDDDQDYLDGDDALAGREHPTADSRLRYEKAKLNILFRRMNSERVALSVHDVLIRGNTKTKDSVIEAEIGALRDASCLQDLLQAASGVNARLHDLQIFDSVNITLDAGPPELPGSAIVVVEVSELKNPLSVDIGVFTRPEARSCLLEGSLRLKNLFGHGELWDGSLSLRWDQAAEITGVVSLPRFSRFLAPVLARVSFLSKDLLKLSSKERSLGVSLGLLSTRNHDLSYNLAWRTLMDTSQAASRSNLLQLGHNLISSIRYTYKLDRRNSSVRPTQGYRFVSTTQVSGPTPYSPSLRFLHQDVDLRYAIPLGFYRAALNFGFRGGIIFPWGNDFLDKPSSLSDSYSMGGYSYPVCSLGGPNLSSGFKCWGLGPTDVSGQTKDNADEISVEDAVAGDLAVTTFADLSFDLPLKALRDAGIHAHAFATAGNLTKLTEDGIRNFSLPKFIQSFSTSAGLGVVVPTKLFRMEVNYCYTLRQFGRDNGKTGLQFSLSSPS